MQMKKNSYNDCLFLLHIAISKACSESGFTYAFKGQLQRFHKLSLFDRFKHVENGLDINF